MIEKKKLGIIFFSIHSLLVIANFIWAVLIAKGDYQWMIVALFVNYIDKPILPLLLLSERLLPHSRFGGLNDWFVHPICLIFGGLFYAFLGWFLGLIIEKLKKRT